jgi:nucleolar protein 4
MNATSTEMSVAHNARKSVENTVFVRFLPSSDAIRRHHVEELFSEVGPIKKSSVIHSKSTNVSYGFVKYTVPEDAALAAVQLNNRKLQIAPRLSVTVKVEQAQKDFTSSKQRRKGKVDDNDDDDDNLDDVQKKKRRNRVIIRNLSFYAKERDIRNALQEFGEIAEIHIPLVPQTKGHRGFCFVTFENQKSMQKCLKATVTIKDRSVNIERSMPKTLHQAQQQGQKQPKKETPKGKESKDIQMEVDPKEENTKEESSDEDQTDGIEDSETESESGSSGESVAHDEEDDNNSKDIQTKQDNETDTTAVSEKRCLFLRNLPFDCTRHDIFEAFRQFGFITSIYIVKDKETHKIPQGSAFVSFRKPEHAAKALESAGSKSDFVSQQTLSTQGDAKESITSANGIFLNGRQLLVDLAVDRQTASSLSGSDKVKEAGKGKDKRNLYLKGEGRVENNEKEGIFAWDELPENDKVKRQNAWSEKNTKLRSPLFFISPNRLSIRNLAKHVDEADLKRLCVEATVRGLESNLVTAEDQIAHWRASGEMNTREILAKIQEMGGNDASSKVSIIPTFDEKNVKHFIPSVHIHRDYAPGGNKRIAPSRGFGFVEFEHHVHALACLREMNNNVRYSEEYATGGKQAAEMRRHRLGKKVKGNKGLDAGQGGFVGEDGKVRIPRLIVEFSVENIAKAKQQAEHRAQQQINQMKQIEENKIKNTESKEKKKKMSRGARQREKKRKERMEEADDGVDAPNACKPENRNEEPSTKRSSETDVHSTSKRKAAKPPKRQKIDPDEENFSKLVETYKQQTLSIMDGETKKVETGNELSKRKDGKRWFE